MKDTKNQLLTLSFLHLNSLRGRHSGNKIFEISKANGETLTSSLRGLMHEPEPIPRE